jgi:hypothetical protein
VSRRSGEVLVSFGRGGQGPGEFESVDHVAPDPTSAGTFWLHDRSRLTLQRFALDGIALGADSVLQLPPLVGRALYPAWQNPGDLTFLAPTDTSAVVRWRLAGGVVGAYGGAISLPGLSLDSLVPDARVRVAADLRGCYDGARRSYVRMHRRAGALEIVDAESGGSTVAAVPFPHPAVFFRDPDRGDAFFPDPYRERVSYMSCATTPEFVLALYSGRRRGAYSTEAVHHCYFVHVFLWDGRSVGVLELKEPLKGIAIDPTTLDFFGIRGVPEPAVLTANLASVLGELRARAGLGRPAQPITGDMGEGWATWPVLSRHAVVTRGGN